MKLTPYDPIVCWLCHGTTICVGPTGVGYCGVCGGAGWLPRSEALRWLKWAVTRKS